MANSRVLTGARWCGFGALLMLTVWSAGCSWFEPEWPKSCSIDLVPSKDIGPNRILVYVVKLTEAEERDLKDTLEADGAAGLKPKKIFAEDHKVRGNTVSVVVPELQATHKSIGVFARFAYPDGFAREKTKNCFLVLPVKDCLENDVTVKVSRLSLAVEPRPEK